MQRDPDGGDKRERDDRRHDERDGMRSRHAIAATAAAAERPRDAEAQRDVREQVQRGPPHRAIAGIVPSSS